MVTCSLVVQSQPTSRAHTARDVAVRAIMRTGLAYWMLASRILAADLQSSLTPADPNALPAVRQLLRDLTQVRALPHSTWLSGQNLGHANRGLDAAYERTVVSLTRDAGQTPAILSVDYGWEQLGPGIPAANQHLIEHWRQGGVVMVSMHPSNPWGRSHAGAADWTDADWENFFSPQTAVAQRWRGTLDTVADGLAELQQAGAIVLWRPFHEMNGDWFWWGLANNRPNDRARFQRLWRETYEYLTSERGLHHLVWVYSPSVQYNRSIAPVLDAYPGGAWVDVVGVDFYGDPYEPMLARDLKQMATLHKPWGCCEFGFGRDLNVPLDNLRLVRALRELPHPPQFVVHWHSWESARVAIVDHDSAVSLMKHVEVVSREEWRELRARHETQTVPTTTSPTTN